MIFIGADHRGFELKEKLKKHLINEGFEITDLGNDHLDPGDDYVIFAHKVADAVVNDPKNCGVILCGSGAGVDMVANKVEGIRSALVFDVQRAIQARQHENANVLSLPADTLDEEEAFKITKAFLTTAFSGEDRHVRRLEEIEEVEKEKDGFLAMVQIIPAILATNEEEYVEKLKKIEESGLFEKGWIQIDLMDSKFVQNRSIGPSVLAKYKTKLKIEAHLMVEYPDNWIDELIKVGVSRIIFPVEDTEGIDERIEHIKNHSIEVGLSLNPETTVANIKPFIGKIDLVLIMSVHPGFSGQQFIPESIEKINECSQLRSNNNGQFKIEVDGGINEKMAKDLTEAGADYLVMGSHIWEAIHD